MLALRATVDQSMRSSDHVKGTGRSSIIFRLMSCKNKIARFTLETSIPYINFVFWIIDGSFLDKK